MLLAWVLVGGTSHTRVRINVAYYDVDDQRRKHNFVYSLTVDQERCVAVVVLCVPIAM